MTRTASQLRPRLDVDDSNDIVARIRWTACTAPAEGREKALVLEIRAFGQRPEGLIDAWVEAADGTRVLCRARSARVTRLDDGTYLHLDAWCGEDRVVAISITDGRVAFARTSLLARTDLAPGTFDPPALELLATAGIDAASA